MFEIKLSYMKLKILIYLVKLLISFKILLNVVPTLKIDQICFKVRFILISYLLKLYKKYIINDQLFNKTT